MVVEFNESRVKTKRENGVAKEKVHRAGRERRQEASWNEGGYIQKTRQGSHQVDIIFFFQATQ